MGVEGKRHVANPFGDAIRERWYRVFVPSMAALPPGFGFSYRCWIRDGAMAYIIPLNLVVRWWMNHLYLPFKNPVTGHADRATLVALAVHDRNYQRGYQQAVRDLADYPKNLLAAAGRASAGGRMQDAIPAPANHGGADAVRVTPARDEPT